MKLKKQNVILNTNDSEEIAELKSRGFVEIGKKTEPKPILEDEEIEDEEVKPKRRRN